MAGSQSCAGLLLAAVLAIIIRLVALKIAAIFSFRGLQAAELFRRHCDCSRMLQDLAADSETLNPKPFLHLVCSDSTRPETTLKPKP